jgi:hypothetical protein
MTEEARHELTRFLLQYTRDPSAARQLSKLPAFAIPQDSDDVFGSLLDKLEQAERRLAAGLPVARDYSAGTVSG